MSRGAAAALACAGVALLAPALARGDAATSAEVAALAERAAADPAALAELVEITMVDGRPVDLAAALAGASSETLPARLAELERGARENQGAGGTAADPGEARAEAAEILGRTPDGDSRPADEAEGEGGLSLPTLGLPGPVLLALAVLVVLAGALTGRSIARRRVLEAAGAVAGRGRRPASWRELDAAANEAERRADYAMAVRLRFGAGIARLGEQAHIDLPPPVTAERAARRLGSPTFSSLASEYERIAFGGRRASADDAASAREGWRTVLAEEHSA